VSCENRFSSPSRLADARVRGWAALVCLGLIPLGHVSVNAAEFKPTGVDSLSLSWSRALSLDRLTTPRALTLSPQASPGAVAATPWPQLLAWAAEMAATNRAADAGVLAAQAQSRQAWASAWMPRVDASASSYQQKQTYNGLDLSIPTSSYTLSATLPLWRAAERASAKAQEAVADQARWQARSNRSSVARELSLAYVSAAENAEQKRLAQAQMQLLQEQLAINERRLQGGIGTVLDVLETRTRVDQARAALQDIQARWASQRLLIERLTAQAVTLPQGFNPAIAEVPVVVPPQVEAQSLAAQRNPQWQDAQSQIDAAQASLKARRAESWQPSVDAVAQANRSRQVQRFEGVSEQQNTTTQSVGLQLNWALFTGGVQQGRTQEGAALLSQAMARQDDVQSQIESSLRDAYQTMTQAQASIDVQHDVEKASMAAFEAVRKAFSAGVRNNQDLLNAQQQIYSARQALVSARVASINAQISILALLDQLDAAGVAPLTSMFDTAALQEHTAP
jgi:outer membrane protein TolC